MDVQEIQKCFCWYWGGWFFVGNGNIHNNYTQLDAENAAAASEADVIDDWYDIENDDFSRRNEQLLLQAEAALDAANALTQGYIDALENSTTLRDELCDDIPALEADYLYKRDLFEDASIHLDPAEAAVTAAEDEVGVQEAAVAADSASISYEDGVDPADYYKITKSFSGLNADLKGVRAFRILSASVDVSNPKYTSVSGNDVTFVIAKKLLKSLHFALVVFFWSKINRSLHFNLF